VFFFFFLYNLSVFGLINETEKFMWALQSTILALGYYLAKS